MADTQPHEEYLVLRMSGGRVATLTFQGPPPTYKEFEKLIEVLQTIKYFDHKSLGT